jgi:hypothetical protein
MADQVSKSGNSASLVLIGFALTAAYLGAFIYFSYLHLTSFQVLGPDGWADFLGGAFAPLAFLWLVLGFLQQGHELRQSAQALHLQAEELRHSVEQQRALVETTREQIDFDRQVLEETRVEHERRRKPILRASAAGGMTSGSIITRHVGIENFGAGCTNVQLEVIQNGVRQSLQAKADLPKGGTVDCQFTLDAADDINGMQIVCRFVDNDHIEGVEKFVITDDGRPGDYFSFQLNKWDA